MKDEQKKRNREEMNKVVNNLKPNNNIKTNNEFGNIFDKMKYKIDNLREK